MAPALQGFCSEMTRWSGAVFQYPPRGATLGDFNLGDAPIERLLSPHRLAGIYRVSTYPGAGGRGRNRTDDQGFAVHHGPILHVTGNVYYPAHSRRCRASTSVRHTGTFWQFPCTITQELHRADAVYDGGEHFVDTKPLPRTHPSPWPVTVEPRHASRYNDSG